MRKLVIVLFTALSVVGIGIGTVTSDPEPAGAAVIYNYVCFEMDGWPMAGGASANPRSAANACYTQLARLHGQRMGYQCPYYGYANNAMTGGTGVVTRRDGNFWDSVMCPTHETIYGTGMFY